MFRLWNQVKKWLWWLRTKDKKKTLKFNVTNCGQLWLGQILGKQSFTEKWTFTQSVRCWNKRKKTLSLTGVDISNYLHLNCILHIYDVVRCLIMLERMTKTVTVALPIIISELFSIIPVIWIDGNKRGGIRGWIQWLAAHGHRLGGSRIFWGGAQGQFHTDVYWLHSSEDPTVQVNFFNKHG